MTMLPKMIDLAATHPIVKRGESTQGKSKRLGLGGADSLLDAARPVIPCRKVSWCLGEDSRAWSLSEKTKCG